MSQLVDVILDITRKSAIEWIARHMPRDHKLDADQLFACIKRSAKAALPEALADAKAADACGMSDVMIHTFAASFGVAGIEAAKAYAKEVNVQCR